MKGPDLSSPRFLLGVQAIVWTVVFIVFAVNIDLANGDEALPICPNVYDALTRSESVPANILGFGVGLIAIGFMWFLTGLLAWVYTRWPRFFLSFRVATGRIMGPTARIAGIFVMTAGIFLLVGAQVGCALSG